MRMELQGSGWYVNLSSGVNMTRNINGHTLVWTFWNNPLLVHGRSIRKTTNYLTSMSTYVDLPTGNGWLSTRGVFYKPYIEKCAECYVDANFANERSQEDYNNIENVISHTWYVITYAVCPVLWCSKLQKETGLSTTEIEYIAMI